MKTTASLVVSLSLFVFLSISVKAFAVPQGYLSLPTVSWNVSSSETVYYYIYHLGSPDIPNDDSEKTAIQAAFQFWENDVGSYINFTYGGNFSYHYVSGDDYRVVDFINEGPTGAPARVEVRSSGGRLVDCDMIFNEYYTFSTNLAPGTYDVANTATHEAGHFLRLFDLEGSEDSEETMYAWYGPQETKKRTLEWGDNAGVRYIYPNRYLTGSGFIETYTGGADVALGNVNGAGSTDMVILWVNDPAPGENSIKYKFGWDISSTSGGISSWTGVKTVPGWVGPYTDGAGVALVNLDATSNLDMVVLWVDDPNADPIGGNTIYYEIGWNLNSLGNPASWSSLKSMPSSDVGAMTAGAAVTFVNLDANSRPEMVVAWVDNPYGSNAVYYKIGWNTDTSGNPTSWSSRFSKSEWVGWETGGLGISFCNVDGGLPDMVLFWIDDPQFANHGKYQLGYNVGSSGTVGSWSATKTFPGDWQWVGDSTQGAGLAAADLNANGRTEMIFLWMDNPSGSNYPYYRVEWESCINSHD